MLDAVFDRARALGPIESKPKGTVDSSRLEIRQVSAYLVRRCGHVLFHQRFWPKLTAVGHVGSYLVAAAVLCRGPCDDSPHFLLALPQARRRLQFGVVLGDATYDAERNHRICREEVGIRRTFIPVNPHRTRRRWPPTKHRRQMRRRFPRRRFGRRWYAESIVSAMNRTLDSALRARFEGSQARECLWRVLAFDLMIIRRHTRASQRGITASELDFCPS